ncbi:hypothetical protein D3C86_1159870 [compost metagenome]|uniref:hypothetical protein n=1 Tax=Variovorax boronicumulans TaxID=436515 RepID=UPI000FC16D58|nr:hypothetical protein [Variovorax boronicumulans]
MQNFYFPPGGPPSAMAAQQPIYQLEGPRYVPNNRSQQAIRLALHERLTRKPAMARQTTTAPWQRMASSQRGVPAAALPFDQEDLLWGEWAGDSLLAIDKLAHECIRSASRMIFFKQTVRACELTKMGHELMRIVPALSLFATRDRCDLVFSPQLEMMFDAFVSVGLSELNFGNPQMWLVQGSLQFASMANGMGDMVRSRGGSASAGRAMQRHDEQHSVKWCKAKAYFAKIARRHPTCDIKRYELELPPSDVVDREALFRHTHEASGIFVRSAKQMYGDAIVGDARLIDRGDGDGHQAHVVLVFDGPSAQELMQMDQALVEIWREQTGNGYVRDVNAMPRFQYRATGHLYRCCETSADQLGKAAIYLARPSAIVEVRAVNGPAGLVIGETSHETKARGSPGRSRG